VVVDVHFRFECHAVGGVEGLFGSSCFGSNSIDGMEDGVSRSVGGVVGRVYLSMTYRVAGRFRVESREDLKVQSCCLLASEPSGWRIEEDVISWK
jgi:hypothetical protein